MAPRPDIPEGRADEAAPLPAGTGRVALRGRTRDRVLRLFNMGCPAPQRAEECEAFARAVAATLATLGLPPPASDTRFALEDQDGNLLAYAVMHPGAGELAFTLYSPGGVLVTTWPPAEGRGAEARSPA